MKYKFKIGDEIELSCQCHMGNKGEVIKCIGWEGNPRYQVFIDCNEDPVDCNEKKMKLLTPLPSGQTLEELLKEQVSLGKQIGRIKHKRGAMLKQLVTKTGHYEENAKRITQLLQEFCDD